MENRQRKTDYALKVQKKKKPEKADKKQNLDNKKWKRKTNKCQQERGLNQY